MATKNIEIQDSTGNIYYPHTDASIVKFGDSNVNATLSDMTQDRIYYCGTTSGTNTYTATNSKITAYADGLTVRVKIGTASTGASTLNINGLGAKTILDSSGNAIVSGGLKAGFPYQLCYNGTNFIVLGKGGGGTATAPQILSGQTATVDSGQVTGTMPNNGALGTTLAINGSYTIPAGYTTGGTVTQSITTKGTATITPGTANQTIAANQYLAGTQTILGDANLVTGNIKLGSTIFGVNGKISVVDTSDANATAAQILASRTAYVNGSKLTGTMATHEQEACISTGLNAAGTLYLKPAQGYWSGDANCWVYAYDADFTAENILSGKNIFGINGTATIQNLGGYKYATGTTVSNSGSDSTKWHWFYSFQPYGNHRPFIEVTGLNFTHLYIVLICNNGTTIYKTEYENTLYANYGNSNVPTISMTEGYVGSDTTGGCLLKGDYYSTVDVAQIPCASYGNFCLPAGCGSATYKWIAIG